MRIRLEVFDSDTGAPLENLGTCLTDNPTRAVQMYNQDTVWAEKGYNADIRWFDITNKAAAALRAIPSDLRSQRSRENGRKGGRPKKIKE